MDNFINVDVIDNKFILDFIKNNKSSEKCIISFKEFDTLFKPDEILNVLLLKKISNLLLKEENESIFILVTNNSSDTTVYEINMKVYKKFIKGKKLLTKISCCLLDDFNNIFDVKSLLGNEKEIINFINTQIEEKSVKSYLNKTKIAFKVEDNDWTTLEELIMKGIFIV